MKLREVASVIDGEITGDPDIEILGVAGVHDVREGEITFLADRRLVKECARSKAACVVVKNVIPEIDKPQVVVGNPHYAFAQLLGLFSAKPERPSGVSDSARVSPHAVIGRDVTIYPFSYISDGAAIGDETVIYPGVFVGNEAVLGAGCIIYPNVTIRERVTIGRRVIIHPGAVIGSDGFGYVTEGGRHHKIPQIGSVTVGDDVEIGANVTIDRATTGSTVIGKGTKIDNLVQIGHNVSIGEHAILAGQAGVGGSTVIGNYVVLGGQVGVADHARIEDGSMLAARSGVFGHLPKGVYSGSPTLPHKEWLKATALFARLPDLQRKVKELEEKLKRLDKEEER